MGAKLDRPALKQPVMLFAFKDETPLTASGLCNLFYVLSMNFVCKNMCIRVQLYTITICTDDAIMDIVICVLNHWLGIFHL